MTEDEARRTSETHPLPAEKEPSRTLPESWCAFEEPDSWKGSLRQMDRLVGKGSGFRLIVAEYEDLTVRNYAIERLMQMWPHAVLFDWDPITDGNFSKWESRLVDLASPRQPILLRGLEEVFTGDQSQTWLNGFNYHRDALARLKVALILWLPAKAIRAFALGAPDTWSWRAAVVGFENPEPAMRTLSVDMSAYLPHAESTRRAEDGMLGFSDKPDQAEAMTAPWKAQLWLVFSLFREPATWEAIEAVIRDESLPGLTDALVGRTDLAIKYAISVAARDGFLERVGEGWRLTGEASAYGKPQSSELEPLVVKTAHQRLCEHYQKICPKKHPDTLDEMKPLMTALWHGTRGYIPMAIWSVIYFGQINRGQQYLAVDLAALPESLALLDDGIEAFASASIGSNEGHFCRLLELQRANLFMLAGKFDAVRSTASQFRVHTSPDSLPRFRNQYIELTTLLWQGHDAQALDVAREMDDPTVDSDRATRPRIVVTSDSPDVMDFRKRVANAVFFILRARGISDAPPCDWSSFQDGSFLFRDDGILDGFLVRAYLSVNQMDAAANHAQRLLDHGTRREFTLSKWMGHLSMGLVLTALGDDKDDAPIEKAARHLDIAVHGFRRARLLPLLAESLVARARLNKVRGDSTSWKNDRAEARAIAGEIGMVIWERFSKLPPS